MQKYSPQGSKTAAVVAIHKSGSLPERTSVQIVGTGERGTRASAAYAALHVVFRLTWLTETNILSCG